MNHSAICTGYSDRALRGIIRYLTIGNAWPERLKAAKAELQRRDKEDAQ